MLMEVLANFNAAAMGGGPGGKAGQTVSREDLEKCKKGVKVWGEIKERSVEMDADASSTTTTTTATSSSEGKTQQQRLPALRSGERCGICLEEWADEDRCRVLECRHVYHAGCVDEWLVESSNTCPMCRMKGVDVEREVKESQRIPQSTYIFTSAEEGPLKSVSS